MLTDEQKAERDDLAIAMKSELWAKAIVLLKDLLQHDMQHIRAAIAAGGHYGWSAPYHFNWGMHIHNKLRQHLFSEQAFGVTNLDNIYVRLVEEAVK